MTPPPDHAHRARIPPAHQTRTRAHQRTPPTREQAPQTRAHQWPPTPSNLSGHIHVYKIGTIRRLHTHGRALYSPPAKTRQPRRATHTLSERVAKSATKRHGVPLVTVLGKQPDSHSHFFLAYKQTMLAAVTPTPYVCSTRRTALFCQSAPTRARHRHQRRAFSSTRP